MNNRPKLCLSPRYQQVIAMRGQGKTYREIGKKFKVSTCRAHQIHSQAKRRMEYFLHEAPMDIFYGLSSRGRTLVKNAMGTDRSLVDVAHEVRVSPDWLKQFCGGGKVTSEEVVKWIGT